MDSAQIDEELRAALYLLGFNFLDGDPLSGKIAEIKGAMTIKLVHPPGEELKFVGSSAGGMQKQTGALDLFLSFGASGRRTARIGG
jgi:hypothetical protein